MNWRTLERDFERRARRNDVNRQPTLKDLQRGDDPAGRWGAPFGSRRGGGAADRRYQGPAPGRGGSGQAGPAAELGGLPHGSRRWPGSPWARTSTPLDECAETTGRPPARCGPRSARRQTPPTFTDRRRRSDRSPAAGTAPTSLPRCDERGTMRAGASGITSCGGATTAEAPGRLPDRHHRTAVRPGSAPCWRHWDT